MQGAQPWHLSSQGLALQGSLLWRHWPWWGHTALPWEVLREVGGEPLGDQRAWTRPQGMSWEAQKKAGEEPWGLLWGVWGLR